MGIKKIFSATYTCGYCEKNVSSDKGMALCSKSYPFGGDFLNDKGYGVYICPYCNFPTFIFKPNDLANRIQIPGPSYGEDIDNLPEGISKIFNEMNLSYSAHAYTGVILLGRTLLNHIAVDHGAEGGKSFAFYVDYLENNGFITPSSKAWVDKIRKLGNNATHDLVINTDKEAATIIKFCEMILKMNFEYPSIADDLTK